MATPDYSHIPETKSSDDASLHRVVIVGGGAGGLELATRLGDTLGKRRKASITLLDSSRIHVWKPHLHEVASGTLDIEAESIEYIAHARNHHYRYRIGAMDGLNREKRQIYVAPTCEEDGRGVIPRRVIGYDTLVIAVGSIGNDFGIPGVQEHAITMDTLGQAIRFNQRLINACLRANAQYETLHPGQLHCVIVGAGATGVELAAELHKSMRDIASYGLDNIDFDKLAGITLIEAESRILPALSEDISSLALKNLRGLGITVRTSTRATSVTEEGVTIESGEMIPSELVVWAAGIKEPQFMSNLDGLESNELNRLVVQDTLQTTRDDNVFAIGDCAYCVLPGETTPVPTLALAAHQMAEVVEHSIKRRIQGKPPQPFRYRNLGMFANLFKYGAEGNMLIGLTGNRINVREGFAKLMYCLQYKKHMQAVHGNNKVILDTLAKLLIRRSKPRIKLH